VFPPRGDLGASSLRFRFFDSFWPFKDFAVTCRVAIFNFRPISIPLARRFHPMRLSDLCCAKPSLFFSFCFAGWDCYFPHCESHWRFGYESFRQFFCFPLSPESLPQRPPIPPILCVCFMAFSRNLTQLIPFGSSFFFRFVDSLEVLPSACNFLGASGIDDVHFVPDIHHYFYVMEECFPLLCSSRHSVFGLVLLSLCPRLVPLFVH